MKHPPYHLRPNKMADRFAFIEAIRRLERLSGVALGDYTYHGLGGPYLEDFRMLEEHCPGMSMVSIEVEEETFKRQQFHLPTSTLLLVLDNVTSYIAKYDPEDRRSIFWLDYTKLEYRCFEDFKALLSMVPELSMIKVTLRSAPRDYQDDRKPDEFRNQFGKVMPDPSAQPPNRHKPFAYLLQQMLRVAAEQALPPAAMSLKFVPICSFYYSDRTPMFTLTGVVCSDSRIHEIEQTYADWKFANLGWEQPKLIDIPVLSTRERLHLQHILPSNSQTGQKLRKALGYLIDEDDQKSEAALEQYADFYRYSPYVMRGVP